MSSITGLVLPTTLSAADAEVTLRRARAADLHPLIALLADDDISGTRGDLADDADTDRYRSALDELIDDPANELVVVERDGDVVGTVQLTRIPGLSRRGTTRLQIEAVRVSSAVRSRGIGTALFEWVIATAAPAWGATLVQLTTDDRRTDAHRFYERLGFVGSHRGFKLDVDRRG